MSCQDTTEYERSGEMIEELADRVSRLELSVLAMSAAISDMGATIGMLKMDTEIIRIEQKNTFFL